jgi:peptidoglycan/xylan/chitin deacetylase (PgdA/CDA1 family)
MRGLAPRLTEAGPGCMNSSAVLSHRAFVTISIDDGHPTDLRTAELLHKYQLKATFYIPATNPEREVMSPGLLRQLSGAFELGGHTMNHVPLPSLPQETASSEIADCKKWLEDLTGKPAVAFCYPKGKFDRATALLVKKAGFWGARTCLFNLHEFPDDPFLWGVSTQAYSHSRMVQMRHALLERNFAGAWKYWKIYGGTTLWQQHFLRALHYVAGHGGIAHLYMHSWEIDGLGQWEVLESVFQAIANQPALVRVTNGDLFGLWSAQKRLATEPATLSIAD